MAETLLVQQKLIKESQWIYTVNRILKFSEILCFRPLCKLMRSRMCHVEQGMTEVICVGIKQWSGKIIMHLTDVYFLHSGGVMIYFDRIEVVNMLVPLAGTKSSHSFHC